MAHTDLTCFTNSSLYIFLRFSPLFYIQKYLVGIFAILEIGHPFLVTDEEMVSKVLTGSD